MARYAHAFFFETIGGSFRVTIAHKNVENSLE